MKSKVKTGGQRKYLAEFLTGVGEIVVHEPYGVDIKLSNAVIQAKGKGRGLQLEIVAVLIGIAAAEPL